MPDMSTQVGKTCVQLVRVLCRKYLHAEYKIHRMWNGSYLYSANTQTRTQTFHTSKAPHNTRASRLIHTFHTPYREQKYIKPNIILNSTVENVS